MRARDYKTEDYDELLRWWNAHDWEGVNPLLLPAGIIIEDDTGKMMSAGFVYCDDATPVCMMEWIVANPDNTPRESLKSLRKLLEVITGWADESGKVLMTSVKQETLAKLYEKVGFASADVGMTNMVRIP